VSCLGGPAGETIEVSRRTERVASLIRNILSEAIRTQLSDPRIEPLTTITRVEVSPYLSIAHVNVSVLTATPAKRNLTVEALNAAARRLRGRLAEEWAARQVPRLQFHLDESIQRGVATVEALDRLIARESPGDSAKPAEPPESQKED
jgi:ribosome-binding factor A